MQGKINRGRNTDHPARRHSIWTHQCPPPPSSSNKINNKNNKIKQTTQNKNKKAKPGLVVLYDLRPETEQALFYSSRGPHRVKVLCYGQLNYSSCGKCLPWKPSTSQRDHLHSDQADEKFYDFYFLTLMHYLLAATKTTLNRQ